MDSFKTHYKYAVHDVPALCEVRPLWGVMCSTMLPSLQVSSLKAVNDGVNVRITLLAIYCYWPTLMVSDLRKGSTNTSLSS